MLNICCLTRVLFVVHKLVVVLKISENYSLDHLGTLFDLYYLYFRKNSNKLSFNYKIFKRYKKKILRVSIKKTELNAKSLNTLTYRFNSYPAPKKGLSKGCYGTEIIQNPFLPHIQNQYTIVKT